MSYLLQSEPLFGDFLWSQPERQDQNKNLLIMGGYRESLRAPLETFNYAQQKSLPAIVVLPDVFKQFRREKHIALCPSTPAGSFSKRAQSQIEELANQADCLLITGDLSNNQETARLIDSLIPTLNIPIIICQTLLGEGSHVGADRLFRILDESFFRQLAKQQNQALSSQLSLDGYYQALSDLKPNESLVVNQSTHWWVKYDQQIAATPKKSPDENNHQLAIELATLLINNPRQVWSSLVSAAWLMRTN